MLTITRTRKKSYLQQMWVQNAKLYSIIIQYIIVLRKFYRCYETKKEKCSQALEHVIKCRSKC